VAGHAERLGEIHGSFVGPEGGVLIAAIADPDGPILPARARAELVAALAVIDYVVIAEGAVEGLLARLGADRVFREERADALRTRDLIARVRERCKPPAKAPGGRV
jgi:hypothetical protein